MAFQWEEDATNRVHLNKHIYYKAHVNNDAVMQVGKTRMQLFKANAGRGQNTSKAKSYHRLFIMYTYRQFYLTGHGATTFIQRKAKKRPHQRRGVDWTHRPL